MALLLTYRVLTTAYPSKLLILSNKETATLARRGIKKGNFIAEGAYASVFEGQYYDRKIAIKKLDVKEVEVASVFLEMLVLKKIRHPYVVRVIDFFLTETEHLLIFMEFLESGDLRDLIFENPLPEVNVAKLYGQFGGGLAFMHNRGFAHRDLKPDNILLTQDQKVAKLTDFGVSVMGYDTYTGQPIKIVGCEGTCDYMAPEVIHQLYYEDAKCFRIKPTPYCPFLTDIWSMGIIVFEMLHGERLPFNMPEDKEWDFKVAYKKSCRVPGKLDKRFDSDLSDAAKNFMKRHLKLKPKHRPDMDELLEDKWIVVNQVLGEVVINSKVQMDKRLPSRH